MKPKKKMNPNKTILSIIFAINIIFFCCWEAHLHLDSICVVRSFQQQKNKKLKL